MNLRKFTKENNYLEILPFYDLMYAYRIKDTNYLINFIGSKRIKEPRLEHGSGTGRVLLPLALKFPEVTLVGVDILEEFLVYCKIRMVSIQNFLMALNKAKINLNNMELYLRDMCQLCKILSSKLKFSTIILCNSTFLHIECDEDRVSLFKNIQKFLSPDSCFFLEYTPLPTKSNEWEKRESVIGYKISRKNKVYNTGIVHHLYKFEKMSTAEEVAEFHATLYPVNVAQINELCQSNALDIKKEMTCYPGEQAGKRKIYLINHIS